MSPSSMPVTARVSSMRPRRRLTRSTRRQLRNLREQRTRGNIWLQSRVGDNYYEEPHLSTDSISDSDRESPSPLGHTARFEHPSMKDSNYTADFLTSDKSPNRLLLLQRQDGLINITIRTIKLMRRNQQLQQRLAQLQAETRAFVRSVMNNPENQGLRLTTATVLLNNHHENNEDKGEYDAYASSSPSSPMETQDEREDSIISESDDSSVAEK